MGIQPKFRSLSEQAKLVPFARIHREHHGIVGRGNTNPLLGDGESRAQIAKFQYLNKDAIRVPQRLCIKEAGTLYLPKGGDGREPKICARQ